MGNEPKRGEMKESRWRLAVSRHLANQEKMATLKFALPVTAATISTQATGGSKDDPTRKNIAASNAAAANGRRGGVTGKSNVTGAMSPVTLGRDSRHCDFCNALFFFARDHARYCSPTCKTDAYLVRRAQKDGVYDGYVSALLSRNGHETAVTQVFTIGHAESYLMLLQENQEVFKVGRDADGYAGGYAFSSYEDAERRISETYDTEGPDRYMVFAIDADWANDTYPDEDGWWHNLLVDVRIRLVQHEG